MENQFQYSKTVQSTEAVSKSFVANVFSWMAFALAVTGYTAYVFGTDVSLLKYLVSETGFTALGYIVLFGPIGLVLVMNMAINKLPFIALLSLFSLFSVMMGMSLSFIFMVYSMSSIFKIFLVTSAMFGSMAIVGYFTKTDLTKFGALMGMGLWGIIIASIVNMFISSPGLSNAISFIAVVVFTGLTAYDVQKIKQYGTQIQPGTESAAKMSIIAAISIYLDFINLFLALLRLFGSRRD